MTKSMKSNPKKKTAALVALLTALALIAGTYMWFVSDGNTTNEIEAAIQDVELLEEYDPGEFIEPGVDVDKKVKLVNNGDTKVVVRARFEEHVEMLDWDLDADDLKIHTDTNEAGTNLSVDGKTAIAVKVSEQQKELLQNDAAGSGYRLLDSSEVSNHTGAYSNVEIYLQDYTNQEGVRKTHVVAFQPATRHKVEARFVMDNPDNEYVEILGFAFYVREKINEPVYHNPNSVHNIDHNEIILTFDENVNKAGVYKGTVPQNKGDEIWLYDGGHNGTNGWYYYNTAIEPGESSKYLLLSVGFNKDLDNKWEGAKYVIDVQWEATQFVAGAVNDVFGPASVKGELSTEAVFFERTSAGYGNGISVLSFQ